MSAPPGDPRTDPRFHRFVALFNEGLWFEAHEVLEALWLDAPAELKEPLQALIQLAVGLEHARRGNRSGALRVLARAEERWRGGRDAARPAGRAEPFETGPADRSEVWLYTIRFEDVLAGAHEFVRGRTTAPQLVLPPGLP